MGDAIVVYDTPELLVTIDSEDYEEMTSEDIDILIKKPKMHQFKII